MEKHSWTTAQTILKSKNTVGGIILPDTEAFDASRVVDTHDICTAIDHHPAEQNQKGTAASVPLSSDKDPK